MTPEQIIGRDGVLLIEKTADKHALLATLAHRLAERAGCDEPALLAAVLKREALGSTGIGDGVAIPHARLANVKNPVGVLAILSRPVDFQAIDDKPVDVAVLLALPETGAGAALEALSCLSRRLRQSGLRADLRRAVSSGAAYEILCADRKP
ncbi:putative PTS IIA-like nitrogen-regulatory protein PtsN [Methylocella silvestris BL2]|uniref:Putative PTS IIA-like nitrogen-regulatory protein PtsN n=1 Tax=Methylocella silvestris (strain DSM 15510 / CIP 108128 / LMG 27833 / NCIMB 13906 / BL2) TaxID=395965 RepID=B8ET97_METSB|nr:PTS sugar transporter subunit IIA [Methylocella silvestris]ACK51739.1 putative PTS IIA-like nitrogen-regulatory protein PtsN [Methylocella silvestris BL2]